jgi:UDP-N-acetylmuramate--alanine ligase
MDEFATAFGDADTLIVLDIYAASEKPIEGVNAQALAQRIQDAGREARYMPLFDQAAEAVTAEAENGDMILTLGAGSVSQLAPMILERLGAREPLAVAELQPVGEKLG